MVQTAVILVIAYATGARFDGRAAGVVVTFVAAVLLTVVFAALSNALVLLMRQQEALIGISQLLSLPLAVPVLGDHGPQPHPGMAPERRALQPAGLGRRREPRGAVCLDGLGSVWPRSRCTPLPRALA